MGDNNTLIWVAVGIGGYLWWKNRQTLPDAGTAPLNAIPVMAYSPVTVPVTPLPAAPVIPVVTQAPMPVSAPSTVNINQSPPGGGTAYQAPHPTLQPPQAIFPVGNAVMPAPGSGPVYQAPHPFITTVAEPNGNQKSFIVPQPVNDALYMQFQNGDYPGASNAVSPAIMHASEMM